MILNRLPYNIIKEMAIKNKATNLINVNHFLSYSINPKSEAIIASVFGPKSMSKLKGV